MAVEENKVKELLLFQLNRKFTDNAKIFLQILESVRDRKILIAEEEFQLFRSKIFDTSNASFRELRELVNQLTIEL